MVGLVRVEAAWGVAEGGGTREDDCRGAAGAAAAVKGRDTLWGVQRLLFHGERGNGEVWRCVVGDHHAFFTADIATRLLYGWGGVGRGGEGEGGRE